MSVKFSEDVVPLTDLKVNPGRVVRQAAEAHRPVLLTSRGRGVAVVQSVADFERDADERDFMRAVVAGLADLDRKYGLDEMVTDDVIFAATGVTDGSILRGARRDGEWMETETVLMRSRTGSVRRISYRQRNN